MMNSYTFVFAFTSTDLAKELNIGDIASLDYENCEYVIKKHGKVYSKEQIIAQNDDVDLLLSNIHEEHDPFMIWDGSRVDKIIGAVVRVISITNNYVLTSPISQYHTDILTKMIDEAKENSVEDLVEEILADLKNIPDRTGLTMDDMVNHSHAGLGMDNIVSHTHNLETCDCKMKTEKEDKGMFSNLGSSFGKIDSKQFRLSINGLTVLGKDDKYYTFNPDTRELVEVTTGFFDDMKDLLFLMPTTELEVSDIILHQGKPYYITKVSENTVKGVDFEDAVESVLIPKTNVFGIKYYTKVFNCLGTNNVLGSDIASNPMMAYALMGGKDFDLSKVMMFQALSGNNKGLTDFSENPIMLMALMSNEKGGELSDFAKMQVLTQLANNKKANKPAKENK